MECSVCEKETETYECENCGEPVCEDCTVPYTLQNQIDYTLCNICHGVAEDERAKDYQEREEYKHYKSLSRNNQKRYKLRRIMKNYYSKQPSIPVNRRFHFFNLNHRKIDI